MWDELEWSERKHTRCASARSYVEDFGRNDFFDGKDGRINVLQIVYVYKMRLAKYSVF